MRAATQSELSYDIDEDPEFLQPEAQKYPQLMDYYPSWHEDALCLDGADEDWFGPRDEKKSMSPKQIKKAQLICNACPVFAICLRQALEMNEQYGVWAGTSGRVRKRIQAMLAFGVVTMDEVIEDYCNGQRGKYERQSNKRDIDADLRGRKDRLRLEAAG